MAKIVNPTQATHVIQVQGRFRTNEALTLYLTNELTRLTILTECIFVKLSNDRTQLTFDFTFKEGQRFSVLIKEELLVYYRGKLLATSQDTQEFKTTEGYIKI
jgi:hypothetical protein